MPIFSTSSLTDIPLVRLRELIMSSRWVRPISEIRRWFIRLKWLEWNESAGLYTPRSLIRKCKVYTTVERERNYKRIRRASGDKAAWKSSYRRRDALSLGIQRFDSLTSPFAQPFGLPVHVATSQAAPFSTFARNDIQLRVKILVVVLALRREL